MAELEDLPSCYECGAVVELFGLSAHLEWHAALERRLAVLEHLTGADQ